jgi:2-C-methyl-D-erythritol 4-phosphate cytidylyltransferase/2-C-methyl-D-erythritol 2,4-cyclodiphosphate synthase
MDDQVWGIIAAAGQGQRFGGDKLAARLADGRSVLLTACQALLHGGVSRLVVVGEPGPEHQLAELGTALVATVPGGAQRSDSIRAGLMVVPETVGWVAVHDAARPFVSPDLVRRCISAARESGAAVPVLPCVDTISQAEGGRLVAALERDRLRRVQTPQVMRRSLLSELVLQGAATDESSVLLSLGHRVATVWGEEGNTKVTFTNDLAAAPRRFISGSGFDVHRYDADRPLFLGGVEIPNEIGLAGHSDADVLLHALVDALLGAVGAGDIGDHFPPSDPAHKDADSAVFIAAAMEELKRVDARLEHVDLTLIGERPRLTPHKQRIRQRLAELLGLPLSSINLKATTTEGLGFTGRGEGLAAQAIASLSLPALKGGG